jgi:DNA-binding PadR family transcriptional regulator
MHTADVTIRGALLQLLAGEERHGYQLKVDFEARTGGIWPLNVGQVYSTLDRLVRDGRVSATDDPAGDKADAAQKTYRITEDGRREVKDWLTATPVDANPPRDELIMKILLAVGSGTTEAIALIDEQRSAMLAELQRGRRQQRRRREGESVAEYLAHDALMTRIEADLTWLDRCEERIRAGMPGRRTR